MNLQNGTLDTRLPQNIIRNFEIPANVEHDKLNPFKIGGGNAIWATHLPPNVNVWFSTNPNFDNAQKLDYMNRGMRFMSIGNDGLQQQYDNFYIFTEGTWNDTIKIAVSSQGDMVEPILSSNTGDIENVGRVASIMKMPVNGASGYNEPDFEIYFKNKYAFGSSPVKNVKNLYFAKMEYDFLNIRPTGKYLLEIDAQVFPSFPLWIPGDGSKITGNNVVFYGFLNDNVNFIDNSGNKDQVNFINYYIEKYQYVHHLFKNDNIFKICGISGFEYASSAEKTIINSFLPQKNIFKGSELQGVPVVCFASNQRTLIGFFNINIKVYSL